MKKIEEIPIEKIRQSENSRLKYGKDDLHELMSSLRTSGLLQPIGIHLDADKEHYHIVYGNRRFMAAQKLGWESIPSIVLKDVDDEEFLVKNLTENVQRKNLSLPEEGRYFDLLIKRGLNEDEVSSRIGVKKKHVQDALLAYRVIPEQFRSSVKKDLRGGVTKGHIPAGAALNIAKYSRNLKKDEISHLMQQVKDGILNSGQISKVTKLMRSGVPMKKAVTQVEQLKTIVLHIPMKISIIDKLEAKYKKDIYQIMYAYVKRVPEFGLSEKEDEEESA